MRRTPSKLETLSLEFFQNLPADFYLTTYYAGPKMLCWHICARDGDTLYFFFGGHDYKHLKRHQSYFNNLYGIIREAVAEGFERVDLGQTAEVPKLKTGGYIVPKRMFLYHHNKLIYNFIKKSKRWIEYRSKTPDIHALRPVSHPTATK